MEETEVKTIDMEKSLLGGTVYVQCWCPNEDDAVQDGECSRVCLYIVYIERMKREIHRLILY